MLRQVVQSQIIHSVGYDADTMLLEVQFRNGWGGRGSGSRIASVQSLTGLARDAYPMQT